MGSCTSPASSRSVSYSPKPPPPGYQHLPTNTSPSPHVHCLVIEDTKHPKVAACLSTASFKLLQIPVALHRLKQKAKSIVGRKVLGLNACHSITGKSGLVKGGGQKPHWHTHSTQGWEEMVFAGRFSRGITMAFRQGAHAGGRDSAWHSLNQIQAQTVLWGGGRRERPQQHVLAHNVVCTRGCCFGFGECGAMGTRGSTSRQTSHQPALGKRVTLLLLSSPAALTGDIFPSALLVLHLQSASSSCQQLPCPITGTMPQQSPSSLDMDETPRTCESCILQHPQQQLPTAETIPHYFE